MKTITVQIGNSDDKLTQEKWAAFVATVDKIIDQQANQIHFFGSSLPFATWQNAAWIFECEEEKIRVLKDALWFVRASYQQDSLAYLEGETQFL